MHYNEGVIAQMLANLCGVALHRQSFLTIAFHGRQATMVTVLRHNTAPHARPARCLQTRCSLTYYSRLSPSLPTLIARPHPPPLRSEFPRLVLWSLPMTSAPLPYRCSLQHAKTGALPTPSQIELPLCLLFSHLPALICFRCQAISRTFARGCDRSPCRRHGVSCRKALPPAARPKRERSSEIPQTVPGEPF